jgi:hypothetical protein
MTETGMTPGGDAARRVLLGMEWLDIQFGDGGAEVGVSIDGYVRVPRADAEALREFLWPDWQERERQAAEEMERKAAANIDAALAGNQGARWAVASQAREGDTASADALVALRERDKQAAASGDTVARQWLSHAAHNGDAEAREFLIERGLETFYD